MTDAVQISINPKDLKDRLRKLTPFMSKELTRYYLRGIYLIYSKRILTAVATNGHILCEMKWDVTPIEDGEFSVILPAEAVRHLVSVIPIKKDNICYMSVIEEHRKIIFNFIDFKYETQAVDGSFPDYKRVIPNGKIKMKKGMKADYLFSALKALNNSPVDISIDDRDTEDSVPHLLTSQEAKGVKCVVMPMRV